MFGELADGFSMWLFARAFFAHWIFVEADGDPTLPATWPSGGWAEDTNPNSYHFFINAIEMDKTQSKT